MPWRRLSTAFAALLTASAFMMGMMAGPRHADAAATITVVNQDGAGEGFNDATPRATVPGNPGITLGAQRLFAFRFAAAIWGAIIDSTVPIVIGANFNDLSCSRRSTILGSAGTETVVRDEPTFPVAATWYPVALANKLAGEDLIPPENPDGLEPNDIGATFNSRLDGTCPFPADWYYGTDLSPPGDDIDFVTVALHEIAHGLGFQTFVSLSSGTKFLGFDDIYMVNLEDHSTGERYPAMTDSERITASTNDTNLHWVGPNVRAASGDLMGGNVGDHVQMYAPSPAQGGSSVSHFDTDLTPDELMEPSFTSEIHDVGLAEELFADIGWFFPNLWRPNLTGSWTKTKEGCASTCLAKGKFVVLNDGTVTSAAGAVLRFHHSADDIFDDAPTDPQIQEVTLGELAPGATQSIKLKGQTSPSSTPASGFIFGVIDADDAEIEEDETDNEILSDELL